MSPGQVHQNFYQITCPCQGQIDYQWIFYLSTGHWVKIYAFVLPEIHLVPGTRTSDFFTPDSSIVMWLFFSFYWDIYTHRSSKEWTQLTWGKKYKVHTSWQIPVAVVKPVLGLLFITFTTSYWDKGWTKKRCCHLLCLW